MPIASMLPTRPHHEAHRPGDLDAHRRGRLVTGGGPIAPEHLPPAMQAPPPAAVASQPAAAPTPVDDRTPEELSPTDVVRRAELVALLEEHKGNVAAVGRVLGKAPLQIRRWIQRYAIPVDHYRK